MVIVSHFRLRSAREIKNISFPVSVDEKRFRSLEGIVAKAAFKARLSEKMAERAFSMASSSNVAVTTLSKALGGRPKFISKEQLLKDEMVKEQLSELFGQDEAEFLKPLLDDEEIELIEQAQAQYKKAKAKGTVV